jgi:hypothetical protein
MRTERMTILVTPAQKAAITQRAKALQLSAVEVIRRAEENYRPSSGEEVILDALATDLRRSAGEARQSINEAFTELQTTLSYFEAKQPPKRSVT